jgi:hypothetical protein
VAPIPSPATTWHPKPQAADAQAADLYEEGRREIFGEAAKPAQTTQPAPSVADDSPPAPATDHPLTAHIGRGPGMEINPLRIAYSKLPMALRNRKFGRPSFHAHSHAPHIGPIIP